MIITDKIKKSEKKYIVVLLLAFIFKLAVIN